MVTSAIRMATFVKKTIIYYFVFQSEKWHFKLFSSWLECQNFSSLLNVLGMVDVLKRLDIIWRAKDIKVLRRPKDVPGI